MNTKQEIEKAANSIKERILFITTSGNAGDNGMGYAYELAANIDAALDVVVVDDSAKNESQAFNNTFNESQVLPVCMAVRERSLSARVVAYEMCSGDVAVAIKDIVGRRQGLSMILLGPGLSKKSVVDAKKLSKNISVPIVIVSGPVKTGGERVDKGRKKMGAIKKVFKTIDKYMEAASMGEMRVDIAREKLLSDGTRPIEFSATDDEVASNTDRDELKPGGMGFPRIQSGEAV